MVYTFWELIKNNEEKNIMKGTLTVSTANKMEFVDVTSEISQQIIQNSMDEGVLYLYNPHTTAGLTINEGADPAVQSDILGVFKDIIPRKYPYKHREGNSPSHIMASLMGSSVTVFIENGKLELGTWQRIFFCEFDGPRHRKLHWQIVAA